MIHPSLLIIKYDVFISLKCFAFIPSPISVTKVVLITENQKYQEENICYTYPEIINANSVYFQMQSYVHTFLNK